MSDEHAKALAAADALAAKIAPLLANKEAAIQGAVLADLTAIWLAGHIVIGDGAATAELRRALYEAHSSYIWDLVDHYDPNHIGG